MLDPALLLSICIPSQQSLEQIRERLKLTNWTDIYMSEATHRNSATESLSLHTPPAGFNGRIHHVAVYCGQKGFSQSSFIQDSFRTAGGL